MTITGTGFAAGNTVSFGGAAASSVTVSSATSITAMAPAEAAGSVDVTVTGVGGTSATGSADKFTFVPAPTVTAVSPTSGSTAGGTSVTITGTGFASGNTVKFGSTAASSVTVNSATSITATAPAEAAGTIDVTVTDVGGTSATSSADRYTYVAPPTVTRDQPGHGPERRRNVGDDHRHRVRFGEHGQVRVDGGLERDGELGDVDHGDRSGRVGRDR